MDILGIKDRTVGLLLLNTPATVYHQLGLPTVQRSYFSQSWVCVRNLQKNQRYLKTGHETD